MFVQPYALITLVLKQSSGVASASTRAFRLGARLQGGWGISKSDVTSVELYCNITSQRQGG